MHKHLKKYTTKQKVAEALLYCMQWGCSIHGTTEFDEKIQKKLKFAKKSDPLGLRSCIDLIEDTEQAIIYFCKYGLQKFDRKINHDLGEMYLKLYGILNAIYLQADAIIELYELLKVKEKGKIRNQLKSLEIFEIRNIVAAHTTTFIKNEKDSKIRFRISQSTIDEKCEYLLVVDEYEESKEFNLYDSIIMYNRISDEFLFNACYKYTNSLFNSAPSKAIEILKWFGIEKFKPYDYQALYKNSLAEKRFYKSFEKAIEKRKVERRKQISDDEMHKLAFKEFTEILDKGEKEFDENKKES